MIKQTETYYSAAYKARIREARRNNPDLTVADIIDMVALEPGRKRPERRTVNYWLTNKPRNAPKTELWNEEHREEARRLLMVERWSFHRVAHHFLDAYGHKPLPRTLRSFLPAGYEYSPRYKQLAGKTGWSAEVRALAMELVIGRGLSPSGAAKRISREYGTGPGFRTIAEWTEGLYTPKPKPMKAVPHPVDDEPGDSWQRAWDAAEGLDGAKWADAVMAAWLPGDRMKDEESSQPIRRPVAAYSRRLAA